jgi:hypothetical protein
MGGDQIRSIRVVDGERFAQCRCERAHHSRVSRKRTKGDADDRSGGGFGFSFPNQAMKDRECPGPGAVGVIPGVRRAKPACCRG